MPALSPEQRKKARDLRIKAQEEADRAAAKRLRGSIAARSSMQGATTKGETVGGAKPQAKPVPRTTPGAAAENNPKGVSDPNDKETQRMLLGLLPRFLSLSKKPKLLHSLIGILKTLKALLLAVIVLCLNTWLLCKLTKP
jgi:hypothetical protein